MENNQRFWLFLVLSMGIWLGWMAMFGPKPAQDAKKPAIARKEAKPAGKQLDQAKPGDKKPEVKNADAEPPQVEKPPVVQAPVQAPNPEEPQVQLPAFPQQMVTIGSKDFASGYRMLVTANTRGATIERIDLIDPRFCNLKDRKIPQAVVGDIGDKDPQAILKARAKQDEIVLGVQAIFSRRCHKCHATQIPKGGFRINTREGLLAGGDTGAAIRLGNAKESLLVQAIRRSNDEFQMPPDDPLPPDEVDQIVQWIELGAPDLTPVTLQSVIPEIDGQFAKLGTSLNTVNWELISDPADKSQASFRITSPDGQVEVTKTYKLHKAGGENGDSEAAAYALDFDLSIKNHSDKERTVSYVLQGPIGLPLENIENASTFRSVKFAYLDKDDGKFNSDSLAASEIADGEINKWAQPILKYIGVDVQYFVSFLQPRTEMTADDSYFESYTQTVVVRDEENLERSDVSVVITSRKFDLAPGKGLTHNYSLFAGPKRADLLAAHDADSIRDLGFFSAIAKIMLTLLGFFYGIIPNYGVAIIMLTVLVRSSMFPLSRKQALGAAKMQEIKPEIDALKKKYGEDREKMGRAQMELFRKHKYNPFSGCLVLFVQMPIFFGLYQALRSSVDLRMAPFLWIDNLAAPDALFGLGFQIPWLGWDQFNLLPIITIGLFILQQKLFMPPATDEQSAMQQKMMGYMMIFMGFMFYKVPAGLCVYFISSSMWGIAERMLLPKVQKKHEAAAKAAGETTGDAAASSNGSGKKAKPVKGAATRKKSRR